MTNSYPTPYSDLNEVLDQLVDRLREVLGDDLLGVYLQGSFASGDYDLHSDVDFAIVIEKELSAEQVEDLQVMHSRIYDLDSRWAQRLDGSYFPKEILHRQDLPDEELWYLDNGHRSLVKSTHCNTLVVRWEVREYGLTLAGPSPDTLVSPVDDKMLRREIYEVITDWGKEILHSPERYNNRFYQSFVVLSYCRMLHSIHTGKVESKQAGVAFAKGNLDPRWAGLIDRTWSGRPNPSVSVREPADPEDFAATLEFIRYVMEESKRVMSS